LVVVKIHALRFMLAADIDDNHRWIIEICLNWLATHNRQAMHCHQEATGEEFIFVGAARVGEYQGNHLLLLSMEILDSSTLDHSAFFGGAWDY
jgi:hypothetical protein